MKDDIISRQAAIDALISEGRSVDSRYILAERIIHESDAIEAISMLPSAEKIGRWNREVKTYKTSSTVIRCSECNVESSPWKWGYRYCPWCGAKMEMEVTE